MPFAAPSGRCFVQWEQSLFLLEVSRILPGIAEEFTVNSKPAAPDSTHLTNGEWVASLCAETSVERVTLGSLPPFCSSDNATKNPSHFMHFFQFTAFFLASSWATAFSFFPSRPPSRSKRARHGDTVALTGTPYERTTRPQFLPQHFYPNPQAETNSFLFLSPAERGLWTIYFAAFSCAGPPFAVVGASHFFFCLPSS